MVYETQRDFRFAASSEKDPRRIEAFHRVSLIGLRSFLSLHWSFLSRAEIRGFTQVSTLPRLFVSRSPGRRPFRSFRLFLVSDKRRDLREWYIAWYARAGE